jgi:hypothetical protein
VVWIRGLPHVSVGSKGSSFQEMAHITISRPPIRVFHAKTMVGITSEFGYREVASIQVMRRSFRLTVSNMLKIHQFRLPDLRKEAHQRRH